MTISYRKLIKWRKEALQHKRIQEGEVSGGVLGSATESESYIEKVLELTQELIDQYLIRRKS